MELSTSSPSDSPKIIRNRIQCRLCLAIVESQSVHDFKWCKCHACAVDGGHEYLKRLGAPENIIELSEYDQ